jgi:hypothetical protein
MKKLVKDANGNVMELISPKGLIPEGLELVSEEEISTEELALARRNKMSEIRAERDSRLLENDKSWLIASKKGESTASIEAEAVVLRDLPEAAETALDALTTVEDIKAYDAFAGLGE